MSSTSVPTHSTVVVIGGGPAGAYTAALLARECVEVVVLESAKFPRYHIGESMLPSIRHFLRFVDLEKTFQAHGFADKPGAAIKFNQHKREGYTDFIALGKGNGSWNVIRSEADEILLRHAADSGAQVFEETKVTCIHFEGDPKTTRPVSVDWVQAGGASGTTTFDWLVDASGRNGLMSTKYLCNRRFNEALKNVACWGYWKGTGRYSPGTLRENAPFFEALTDESGWAWFIPLHNGTTSVGVVERQDLSISKKAAERADNLKANQTSHYLLQLQKYAPNLMRLIGNGQLVITSDGLSVKAASDFSYNASRHAGPRYRIVGDAGAFIDPFFSSGVHLALSGGLAAAGSICASIRDHCAESEAENWFQAKIGLSYTRFLVVVLSVYKQIRALDQPVLSDFDSDNFDRAFKQFRVVIQGAADVGETLSSDELQKTLQFCSNLFAPTRPEDLESVSRRVDPELTAPSAPAMNMAELNRLVDPTDEQAKAVLGRLNAWKVMGKEHSAGMHQFGSDPIDGLVMIVEKGKLGLFKVAE